MTILDRRPRGMQFDVREVLTFLTSVLKGGAALRSTSAVFGIFAEYWELATEAPHWTTGRMWLIRLGLFKLTRLKEKADDWIWFADHTVQIGIEKCLVVLGIRQCHLPPEGTCLALEHLEPLLIEPMPRSNSELVHQHLESLVEQTGIPRAILNDHGSDLHGGVQRFCERHPQTLEIYDVTHQAARLLKSQLESDEAWSQFCTHAGRTKFQTQQTELAFLVPPSQRSKARYMNLGPIVNWGQQTLKIVESPSEDVLKWCTHERLEEKFGWLREYREPLARWTEWLEIVTAAEQHVRRDGLTHKTAQRIRQSLTLLATRGSGVRLAGELIAFVNDQCQPLREDELLPGTTEPLECAFGKQKSIERSPTKTGFTSLLLTLGAVVGQTTATVVDRAMQACGIKHVKAWCNEHLGTTLQSKRQIAYTRDKMSDETSPTDR